MKRKSFILFFILSIFTVTVYAGFYADTSNFKLLVNGNNVYSSMINVDGHNYAKLRDISDNTSLEIEWDIEDDGNSYVNFIDTSLFSYEDIILFEGKYYIDMTSFVRRYYNEFTSYYRVEFPYEVSKRSLQVGQLSPEEQLSFYIAARDYATIHKDFFVWVSQADTLSHEDFQYNTYVDYDFFKEKIAPYYFDIILENEMYFRDFMAAENEN